MPGLSVALLAMIGALLGMSGMFTSDICEDDDHEDVHQHDHYHEHHYHTHDDEPDEPVSM